MRNKNIPTIKMVDCPACGKKRLGKYANEDGSVDNPSQATVEVRDNVRYLEVCPFCIAKYQKEDKRFVKENLRKLAQAIRSKDDEDETDHRDFSLN